MPSHKAETTTPSRSRLTKALVASGLGVALLAGGGATFADWYDSTTTEAAAITSGDLGLTAAAGTWSNGVGVVDVDTYRVVPGETLTYTQDVTIDAVGGRLTAVLKPTVASPDVTGNNELARQLVTSAQFAVDGTPFDATEGRTVTAADDGDTLAVTLQVTFPSDAPSGTSAQEQTVTLGAITVELQQTPVDPA